MINMSLALNLYSIFIHGYTVKKIKNRFKFFYGRRGGQAITFFVNYATYKNCHEHSS
jgi:hypothetical protein